VAEKVLDFFIEFNIKKVIVVAGYGMEGNELCCAATSNNLLNQMKNFGIEIGYTGPFYSFSGIVFGLAKRKNMEAISLFAKTEPNVENPEFPDEKASQILLDKLIQILFSPSS
jgi:proteasome assembly chaperone (PAC2) family protein